MAKQEKGEKANLYLLAIVAIVAVVGIVVLILNSAGSTSLSSSDYSGQAIKSGSIGASSMPKIIKIGTGKSAIVAKASDCGDSCDICGCDANGQNCKCQD